MRLKILTSLALCPINAGGIYDEVRLNDEKERSEKGVRGSMKPRNCISMHNCIFIHKFIKFSPCL